MITNRQDSTKIIELTYRYIDSYLIYLAARLNIFSSERRQFTLQALQDELAQETGKPFISSYLQRILRSLCTHKLLTEKDGVYAQTELGEYLSLSEVKAGILDEFADDRWQSICKLSAADITSGNKSIAEIFLSEDYTARLPIALTQLIKGYQQVKMLILSAELAIFELLNNDPQSATKLADSSGIDKEQVSVLLNYLADMKIINKNSSKYTINPLSALMRRDSFNMSAFILHESKEKWLALAKVYTTLHTGEDAFTKANGLAIFDYLKLQPELANIFHEAMTAVSTAIEIPAIVDAIAFTGTIMDMGGGQGQLLAKILERNPETSGIIFDLPEVVEKVQLSPLIKSRCRLYPGSFFAANTIPTADTIILKRVLHDWDDEKSETILRNCQLSLAPKGRVLIIEYLADSLLMEKADLMMMAIGGKGRTTADFQRLANNTGMLFKHKVALTPILSMIEMTNGRK